MSEKYLFSLNMAENEPVLEGFICPMCMTEFKAPDDLHKHFEEFHNDNSELLKSFKGIDYFFLYI